MSLFAIGAISLAAFILLELHQRVPMLDLTLFKSGTFTGANIVAILVTLAMFGIFVFFPIYMQTYLGWSPVQAGAALLPWTIMIVIFAPIARKLSDRGHGRDRDRPRKHGPACRREPAPGLRRWPDVRDEGERRDLHGGRGGRGGARPPLPPRRGGRAQPPGRGRGMTRLSGPERRAAVVETACRIFAKGSYHGSTTAEIARATGVTEPVLYRHFASKRELYLACLDSVWEQVRELWEKAIEREQDPSAWLKA